MNDKIIKLLVDLGFSYKYCNEENTMTFIITGTQITFDFNYDFIAVDNNVGEYTIDFDELENIKGRYLWTMING